MNTSRYFTRSLVAIAIAQLPLLALAAVSVDHLSPTTPGATSAQLIASQGTSRYVQPANVFTPQSSQFVQGDAGIRAHTNYHIHNPRGVQVRQLTDLALPAPEANPQSPPPGIAEYPASLACVYKVGRLYPGCVPTNNPAYNATGGIKAIAIVDAFDNPTAIADLQYFSAFFGLPAPNIEVVYANGNGACVTPPYDAGWALESALDTQWAHAMAPASKIILVEACSNSYADLMYAEQIAAQKVVANGGGQVSNSWSSPEWPTESGDWDWVFRANWVAHKPVMYLFSAGDSGIGAQYPSASPWVISVGGTTINRDPVTQNLISESCWAGSGGGLSQYETYSSVFGTGTGPWTNYQYPLFGQSARNTPDISFDADPASGAWVNFAGNWYVAGGTSLSAPAVAGIISASKNQLGEAPPNGGYYSNTENDLIYAQLQTGNEYHLNYYDVTTGSNGVPAAVGWDSCTGVGSPRGKLGK